MAVNIGGINIADALINAEFRLGVLEKVVDLLIRKTSPGSVSSIDMNRFREETVAELQKKYPNAGIKLQKDI